MLRRLLFGGVCALLVAGPAQAENERRGEKMLDVGSRVVFGIPLTIAGGVLMIPAGLATLVTRPSELDTTFDYLVMGPVRYTWVDPLGEHPDPAAQPATFRRDRYAAGSQPAVPQGTPSGD